MNELTDLEICKRIAEIEGVKDGIDKAVNKSELALMKYTEVITTSLQEFCDIYNPLTDDALCFRLMVKYEVDIDFYLDVARIQSDYSDGRPSKGQQSFAGGFINQAICLAIIKANEVQS